VGDANIKRGAYARDMGEAPRVLGEHPKDLDQLRESLNATWQPANGLEGRLVKGLARRSGAPSATIACRQSLAGAK
jgi:hypothetical protein